MTDSFSQFQSGTQNAGPSSAGVPLEQSLQAQQPDLQNLSAQPYADLKYLFGVQDPAMLAPKSGRNRRKSTQGSEYVKHRRTRSGCYTCRGRRVKCDEKHPICERCKKGNRECKYPEPVNSTKPTSSTLSSTQQSPGSSSEDYEDDEEDAGLLGSVMDEEDMLEGVKRPRNLSNPGLRRRNTDQSLRHQKSSTRRSSETPSLDKGPSPSPSTEGSVGYPGSAGHGASKLRTSSLSFEGRRENWAHLPEDLQYYLLWFYEKITCQHYSLKHDSGNFLKTIFLDQALKNEALLNGIVGFAAFQHNLQTQDARMQFLQYYNKAVSLLLMSLKRGDHRHSIGTLLTILQLATIEEYLGDWINLLGHQKAAFEILTYLYTPENVTRTEIGRCVLKWYSRFDVFGSLMGGYETVLSREWFSSDQQYLETRAREHPENLDCKIDAANSSLKLIAVDMSVLFTMIGKGAISREEFMVKNAEIAREIADWKENMDPALQDPRYVVTEFSTARPLNFQDIVNPYRPGILYAGPLWPINVSTIDWYALGIMHQYQTSLILGTSIPNNALAVRAFCTCELFEAIECWPGSQQGSVIGCQASLGIASLFLPRDPKHSMWLRRKLATIESNGYIYPLTFRKKMSTLFQDPSILQWWLPNEEYLTPIVHAIRSFVESRTTQAIDVPQTTEDLSNMKAIFSNLKLDDGDETSLPSPPFSSREEEQDGDAKGRTEPVVRNWNQSVGVHLMMGDVSGMAGTRLGEMRWADTPSDVESPHGYWIQEQESQHPQYDDIP